MNYNALTLFPHKLPTTTLDLSNYHFMTLSPFPSVKGVKSNGQLFKFFFPMNYNALILFPHELPTTTLDRIKLSFYDTFSISVSQRG
jgi:hypothetical protein